MDKNYNIGEKILLPYLLDKRIDTIDYMLISHFDSDHSQGCVYIMKELKVKNIIIAKQFESSENYEEFLDLVKEKNIKVYVAEMGQRVYIEKDMYFDILWPDSKNIIIENILNNNSLVCKFVYKDFSMLFTGDIEEVAEKEISKRYKNNSNILQSTILKVAHHGSKTSSNKEFLEMVRPKIALIGVGKDNTFGHPSNSTLKSLNLIRCKTYRTDDCGEITIQTNGKNIRTEKFIK